MRVIQLIDSLEPGGAERVAVNFANALVLNTELSALCVTRKEGVFKQNLHPHVQYLFLNKKSALSLKAIKKLNQFIKSNSIQIIHAHTTSFFIGTIIKILNPRVKLIWHDHHGNRLQASPSKNFILKLCSLFFTTVITVNNSLKSWAKQSLLVNDVYCLVNYPVINSSLKVTKLQGEEQKKIVCLANLRPAKDQINLLKAFALVNKEFPDWSLHLVGNKKDKNYLKKIELTLKENKLENSVFIYGSCPDINYILSQCTIGVLSSKYEGLPLALLEYGLAGLPCIATNVGDCNKVISNNKEGVLILPNNPFQLKEAMVMLIENEETRTELGNGLKLKVQSKYSEESIIKSLLKIYKLGIS